MPKTMEQMDREVHESLKVLFDTLLLQMIRKAKEGDQSWTKDYDQLYEVFCNTVDSNVRCLARVRELEQSTIA